MIFKLHYWFVASGANALGILLGVFMAAYTDFSSTEIGLVYMLMPFCSMICRPIVCSFADRNQAHQKYLVISLVIAALGYLPFVIIPLMGPQFYDTYPRLSGYTLLAFKIIGDIAFTSSCCMGDSLAINYAHRVGTDFGVYRIWATISWMVFGLVVGQINEIWFLPRYVPAFIILISASLLDALLIWLWPAEYFVMVPMNQTLKSKAAAKEPAGEPRTGSKVLLPRAVVWAHAKRKLWTLLTCSCFTDNTKQHNEKRASQSAHNGSPLDQHFSSEAPRNGQESRRATEAAAAPIDRKTQMTILMLLLRRDPRILLYALVFVCAGFTIVPISFFFMSLSDLCHSTNTCDFSQLAGLLQMSMASVEAILFCYIRRIIEKIGRLNALSIAFALGAFKYAFYATIWPSVNPYFSILSEVPHGLMFATYLVLMVELAHFFSNEVEFIIPELVERGVVRADDEATCERLKMSLAATMQALMSSANDGFGRGFGALVYGFLIDRYGYHSLWLIIALGCAAVLLLIQAINCFDHCLDLKLGLDQQFQRKLQRDQLNAAAPPASTQIKENGLNLSDNLDTISIHSKGRTGIKRIASSPDSKMQQIA